MTNLPQTPTPSGLSNKAIARGMRHSKLFALLLLPLAAACTRGPLIKAALDDEVLRMCAIDGGVKVYETLTLPAAEYDKYAAHNWILPERHKATVADPYYVELTIQYYRKGNPELSRWQYQIVRKSDGKVLGESISYGRGGGDLPGPWHGSSFECPAISKDKPALAPSIFQKGNIK